MKKKVVYGLLVVVIFAFAFREIGGVAGRIMNINILPEWLRWIEDLDKLILFFSDRGGEIYSIINWTMIVGGFFFVGLLRKLGNPSVFLENEESIKNKIVKQGENPFRVAVPSWFIAKSEKKENRKNFSSLFYEESIE